MGDGRALSLYYKYPKYCNCQKILLQYFGEGILGQGIYRVAHGKGYKFKFRKRSNLEKNARGKPLRALRCTDLRDYWALLGHYLGIIRFY